MEQLKKMKECLTGMVESQVYGNIDKVDAKELGEAVDMIKDLAEAIYYCTITEAMEGEEKEGKGFFGKKKDKKTAALEEKVAELEDRTKRQMAEFENFRKRTEKEKSIMFETGAKSVIEKILPVIDNFERGLAAIEPDNKDSFYDGMCMIHKQMLDELEKIGVTPIEALGKEFDPNFHNAVMQVESDEFESGVVAQELQKGYMYRDTVVRYSMVGVVS